MLDVQKEWMDNQIRLRDEAGPKPTAFNTPFRVSDSGACIRKRTLSALDAMESDEFSSQTYMAFEIGNAVHKSIQDALDCDGNGWYFESEVPIDLTEVSKKVGHGIEEFGLSGHCDGIITQNGSLANSKSWFSSCSVLYSSINAARSCGSLCSSPSCSTCQSVTS